MIYILPGMGADSNMYSGPWLEVQNVQYLDWPDYHGEKTLSEVADRVIIENCICRYDTVSGSSLGGIVSLEIAEKLGIDTVILFGSAISKTEISPMLRMLTPFIGFAPIKFLQAIAGRSENQVLKMFNASDENFIRSMCIALNNWQGFKGDRSIIKRIHGDKDRVIACHGKCKVLKNGGHLIAFTHARECVEILKQYTQ